MMENFGSEIGQKMRSAVKAKLVELGTGGSTGYIDDELPDYVMIMVANKRSKQQMITDLNLFLGEQTEHFVNWLHEVLQKLQEVTLPAASALAKKRKSSQKEEVLSKKDKKTNKKEKKGAKKSTETATEITTATEADRSSATAEQQSLTPVVCSITDVFAEDLLEKAKKTLNVTSSAASSIKKGKEKKPAGDNNSNDLSKTKETNDFDIPTISEISSTTTDVVTASVTTDTRQKDLAELAEIQRKIYAAKKHLKLLGEVDISDDESDYLNATLDEDSANHFDATEHMETVTVTKPPVRVKSPIIFDRNEVGNNRSESTKRKNDNNVRAQQKSVVQRSPSLSTTPPRSESVTKNNNNSARTNNNKVPLRRSRERSNADTCQEPAKKRPIHERLGIKSQASRTARDRPVRKEQQLYVPAFRRQDPDTRKEEDKRSQEHLELTYESEIVSDEETEPQVVVSKAEKLRKRLGSSVIVAPSKSKDSSDEELQNEKPVNSVIQVKPRPPMSPSKQACKNLLLRAMADAQRSTLLAKSKSKESSSTKSKDSSNRKLKEASNSKVYLRLGDGERVTKITSKSYRKRLKRNVTNVPAGRFARSATNFIIEVEGKVSRGQTSRSKLLEEVLQYEEVMDEEYVPESVLENCEIDAEFLPEGISNNGSMDEQSADDIIIEDMEVNEAEEARKKTQFVVTLNDDKSLSKYSKRVAMRATSPPTHVSSSVTVPRKNYAEASSSSYTNRNSRSRYKESRRSNVKSRLSSKSSPASPAHFPNPEHERSNSSQRSPKRTELIEIYRKPMEIKKIIIKNDTDDEEVSPKKSSSDHGRRSTSTSAERSKKKATTPPLPATIRELSEEKSRTKSSSPLTSKHKHIPIKFDLEPDHKKEIERETSTTKRRSKSGEKEYDRSLERRSGEERRRISIRASEVKKYDNIPSLNNISVESNSIKVKPKERCKYHPNCTKHFCEYYHPLPQICKSFPNCKFGEKCIYTHPKCKYDISCSNADCNYFHSSGRSVNAVPSLAPPLSSHVVPVQNYKTISAPAINGPLTMCKFYPNCSKLGCTFYHPKPCRFGKNCINKLECNFYHHEIQSSSKFKWVASVV